MITRGRNRTFKIWFHAGRQAHSPQVGSCFNHSSTHWTPGTLEVGYDLSDVVSADLDRLNQREINKVRYALSLYRRAMGNLILPKPISNMSNRELKRELQLRNYINKSGNQQELQIKLRKYMEYPWIWEARVLRNMNFQRNRCERIEQAFQQRYGYASNVAIPDGWLRLMAEMM